MWNVNVGYCVESAIVRIRRCEMTNVSFSFLPLRSVWLLSGNQAYDSTGCRSHLLLLNLVDWGGVHFGNFRSSQYRRSGIGKIVVG